MDQMLLWTIIGVVVGFIAFGAGWIYWCGGISSKVDMVVQILGEIKANMISQGHDIRDLEGRVTRLEDRKDK